MLQKSECLLCICAHLFAHYKWLFKETSNAIKFIKMRLTEHRQNTVAKRRSATACGCLHSEVADSKRGEKVLERLFFHWLLIARAIMALHWLL